MSGGGLKGGGSTESQSASEQFSRSYVDPAQAGFLQQLRSGAAGLTPQVLQQLQATGIPGIEQIAQQARGALGRVLQGPQTASLADRMGQYQSGVTDPAVSQLGTDIQRQVQRAIGGAGGTRADAALSGTLGGGRNQVENALVQESGINAFARGAQDIRMAGEERALRAAGLEGQEDLQGLASIIQGLGQAGGIANLGLAGPMAQFAPYAQFGNILGGPTVLSESEGSSSSSSVAQQQQGLGSALGGAAPFLKLAMGMF